MKARKQKNEIVIPLPIYYCVIGLTLADILLIRLNYEALVIYI